MNGYWQKERPEWFSGYGKLAFVAHRPTNKLDFEIDVAESCSDQSVVPGDDVGWDDDEFDFWWSEPVELPPAPAPEVS